MSTGRLGAGDTAIQPTILNAKGDLIVATAADTPAALTVGANGTVLTAASGEATGLQWAAPAAGSTNGSVGGFYMSSSTITQINLIISGGTFDAGTYYVWSFA
jgi:hypothetical protein